MEPTDQKIPFSYTYHGLFIFFSKENSYIIDFASREVIIQKKNIAKWRFWFSITEFYMNDKMDKKDIYVAFN